MLDMDTKLDLFPGTPKDNVGDMLNKNRNKSNPLHGEDHYMHKLNVDAVKEIKERLGYGYSPVVISRIFHVSLGAIRAIKEGKTWKHVE